MQISIAFVFPHHSHSKPAIVFCYFITQVGYDMTSTVKTRTDDEQQTVDSLRQRLSDVNDPEGFLQDDET